jgi:hypothetical protein
LVELIGSLPLYAVVVWLRNGILSSSIRHIQDRRDKERRRVELLILDPRRCRIRYAPSHPANAIRLGYRLSTGDPFDVPIAALGVGGAVIGQPGMGKTVLLTRLVEGLVASAAKTPCLVAILDGKEDAGLRDALRSSAGEGRLPFSELSSSPTSLGYDPIGTSSPEVVASKIINTMDFGMNAGIYKEIAGHVLALIVSGLQELDQRVTLPGIRNCMTVPGLLALAGRTASPDLMTLAGTMSGRQRTVQSEAMLGTYHRLSRLLTSKYGSLLVSRPGRDELSFGEAMGRSGVVYIGVSTHGGSDDARLLVNVILSDLGELARQRNAAIAAGVNTIPMYLFIDEFAQVARGGSEGETAATEARLSNTFELARSSLISPFPTMQVLPKTQELLSDVFGAGVLVILRTAQAEECSKRLGTVPGGTVTHQLAPDGHATGHGEGSFTPEREWAVSPDILRLGNNLPEAVLLQHENWAPQPSGFRHRLTRTGASLKELKNAWLRKVQLVRRDGGDRMGPVSALLRAVRRRRSRS